MTDMTLPVWSFRTDWSNGLLEALEWATSVQQSNKAAEQRRALRVSPRRYFETQLVVTAAERTRLNAAITAGSAGNWNVPLPWDVNPLIAPAQIGDQTVYVEDTTTSEFQVGGLVFFRGEDSFTYEVRQITAVAPGSLSLDQGVVRPWPRGTKLLPMRRAMLTDQPSFVRKADRSAVYAVHWQVTETNDYPAADLVESYKGYPIFRIRPDDTNDLSTQYGRLLDTLDTNYSIPARGDTAGLQLYAPQYAFFLHGRSAHADFRGLLYALRGRVTAVWLPTYSADMVLARPIANGDTTITIKRSGLADFFTTLPEGQRDVIFDPRNASAPALYRRVLDVTLDLATGDEVLTVDAAFTQDIFATDLKRVSFMSLARLNQDRVEINHQTDSKGVSTAVVSFQTTPENRSAADYDVTRFTQTTMTPDPCICGSECGAWGDVRTNGRDPLDPRAGEYPQTEANNLDAMADLMRANGGTESAINDVLTLLGAQLDRVDSTPRDHLLNSVVSALVPLHYDFYAPLDDTTLRTAVRVLTAYYAYLPRFVIYAADKVAGAAVALVPEINDCSQVQSETVLATCCINVVDILYSQAEIEFLNSEGSGAWWAVLDPPLVGNARGTVHPLDWAIWTMSSGGDWPEAAMPPFDDVGMNSLGYPLRPGLVGLNEFQSAEYLQPGCGSVVLSINEMKGSGLAATFLGAWPPGSHIPITDAALLSMAWHNYFSAHVLSVTPWPGKVKMRQRNSNGQTIRETVLTCASKLLPGTSVYANAIRAYPYLSYRDESTGPDGAPTPLPPGVRAYYANPDADNWHVLRDAGALVIDFLTVDDDTPLDIPTVVRNQDLTGLGG